MIVGASFDTPKENKAFAEAEGFPFKLLADADRWVGRSYDVDRGPDEQFGDFPRRRTFLIDPQGVLRGIYHVTDVGAHPQQVLDDLRELNGC